jgi:hypothetical protein
LYTLLARLADRRERRGKATREDQPRGPRHVGFTIRHFYDYGRDRGYPHIKVFLGEEELGKLFYDVVPGGFWYV